MKLIYGIAIRGYYLIILILSAFHWKAKQFIRYRRGWRKTLMSQIDKNRKRIWLYAPSIGEFQECKKFVKRLTEEKKDYQFIFTFFSPSGYDQAKIPGDHVVRLMFPTDTKRNARDFLNIVRPTEAYILATGIWANFMTELQKRDIPHYMISFYGRDDSSFFHPLMKNFFRQYFITFRYIFVYNNHCKELLLKHYNYDRTIVIYNGRFDSIIDMYKNLRQIEGIKEFVNGKFCFVAGSTEKKEDELLVQSIRNLKHLDMKWIIVPHEKLKKTLDWYKEQLGDEMCFYKKNFDPSKRVLVYDTTGDLFQLYQYSDMTLVGRGFHRLEIHNMLEPAIHLKPVLIGPKHKKFVEPVMFIENKLAFEFKNEKELSQLTTDLYNGTLTVDKKAIQDIFKKYSGGAEIAIQTILKDLDSK